MANPVQKIIELAKKGDRRVLLGGAAVVGVGVGFYAYTRKKGVSSAAPSAASGVSGDTGSGGGGGGSGADLTDTGISLPTLPDLGLSPDAIPALNLPDNSVALPTLAPVEQPSFPSLLPTIGGILPTLPSYSGSDYSYSGLGLPSLNSGQSTLAQATGSVAPTSKQGQTQTVSKSLALRDSILANPVATEVSQIQSTPVQKQVSEAHTQPSISTPVVQQHIVDQPAPNRLSGASDVEAMRIAQQQQNDFVKQMQARADAYNAAFAIFQQKEHAFAEQQSIINAQIQREAQSRSQQLESFARSIPGASSQEAMRIFNAQQSYAPQKTAQQSFANSTSGASSQEAMRIQNAQKDQQRQTLARQNPTVRTNF